MQLHNGGSNPLILLLGTAGWNGRDQRLDAVHYSLRSPDGKVLQLELRVAGIASGRNDPLVLPLPAGATFSYPLDLKDCWAPDEKLFELNLRPGRYSLEAQFDGKRPAAANVSQDLAGIRLMPFWSGTVESSPAVFTVSAHTRQNQK